jgi:hypothetical protein
MPPCLPALKRRAATLRGEAAQFPVGNRESLMASPGTPRDAASMPARPQEGCHLGEPAQFSAFPVPNAEPPEGVDDENRKWCTATIAVRFILEFAMNDVVERILSAYKSMRPLDAEQIAGSRQKISRYIESLASAGQRDAEQLTIYGLAYLTELQEGYDPRFSGC